MASTFFGLNIAYTGLLASNAALNTTSNNIANVQTVGYSRQQVTQQAASALKVFQTYGCAGAGVETLAIERVRDEFYDFRYWSNNSKVGEYAQKQYYMQQIEAYFDDNGQNAGFKTVFDQLMISGLQAWMDNPNDNATKQQFIGFAGSLAEYFNGVAGNLQKVQKDANQEIKLKVDEINSIAGEIATLNKQINTIELAGSRANELRDRRELLIDQLSQIVDTEVQEIPITDPNMPDRDTGAHRYIIRIAGGQTLVDGNDYKSLECVARRDYEKVNQSDIDGLYDVYWGDGQKFNLYSGAMGGELKGLIDLRDGNNGENFMGEIVDIGKVTGQDNITRDTVTINVNRHYLTDLNKCNLSDQGGIIKLGNQEFNYDSWTYSVSYDANGEPTYSYTFTISDSEKNGTELVTNHKLGMTATVGAGINYQGVPYYMAQMNEWVRTFSQKFNDILTSGYSGEEQGIKMFTAGMPTDDKQYTLPDDKRYDLESFEAYTARVDKLKADLKTQLETEWKDNHRNDPAYAGLTGDALEAALENDVQALAVQAGITAQIAAQDADIREKAKLTISAGANGASGDNYYMMTALNVDILSALELDPSRLANKKQIGDGVEQNDLLEDLKDLASDKNSMSFRGSSASEFLQCILSDIALNAKRAETFYQSFSDIAYTIDTQRASISGVDEDEEAANLVKFQNGYNLACKMIQTLSEVYDRLILQTGV